MRDSVTVLTPELLRGAGGVADYAWRVAEEWGDRAEITFVLPEGARADTVAGVSVKQIARNAQSLRRVLPEHGGKVLLNYSAYGFDRWGYPRWLLHELARWKKSSSNILVVVLHEIWTFWPVLNKNYVVQQLHRRDIAKLIAAADAVFTTTASQAQHLCALDGRCEVNVLPAGSTIAVPPTSERSRVPGLAVLFGLQKTRVRTLATMQQDLRALAGAEKITRIVTCGADSDADDERQERDVLGALNLRGGFEQRGRLPETEVAMLFAEASFGISAQDELSLTKSSAFMAYAAHGLNILSPHASPAGGEPLCWLTSPADLLHHSSPDDLKERALSLRDWQQRNASWPHIAGQLARALRLGRSVAK